jgi:hypothetical protein
MMTSSPEKGGDMETSKKSIYETPEIEDHGDLTELTAGLKEGEETDKEFPIHTPKKDLTFTAP